LLNWNINSNWKNSSLLLPAIREREDRRGKREREGHDQEREKWKETEKRKKKKKGITWDHSEPPGQGTAGYYYSSTPEIRGEGERR